MKDLIVLKLGGSVLTDKSKPFTPCQENIKRLSKEIAQGHNKGKNSLAIVHGAGSFGHHIVSRTGIHEGITKAEQLMAFAETQRWQNHWNSLVTEALQEEGLPAIPCQPSSLTVMEFRRLVWMPLDAVRGFLEIGLIPVLYGVPAYDKGQRCSILSGDQIVPYVARELGAKRVILGTNVDGVFTDDPFRDPKARLIKEITRKNFEEVKKHLAVSSEVDITGGMLAKVIELMGLAKRGIDVEIVNAKRNGFVERALSGESGLGTVVRI